MFNSFTQHEKHFRDWINTGYPDLKPETREFLSHIIDRGREKKLWKNQEEALLRTIYSYEILGKKNLLLNIVTGGGKTLNIAATIAWLRMAYEIRSFLILTPNIIVRDRLESDFRGAKIFHDFSLFPPMKSYLTDELELHILGHNVSGMLESGVILGNIQQLYTRGGQPSKNLAYIMNYLGDLAIFNDEAHNTPAQEYTSLLLQLGTKSKFRLDTTATPERADTQQPDSEMIYEYGVKDALADGLIKSTVVYQPDIKTVELTYTDVDTGKKAKVEEIDWDEIDRKGISPVQWVTDTKPLKQQLRIALSRLEEQKQRAKGRYKPVLFVVTVSIKDAKNTAKVMEEDFGLKTLLLTEEDVDDQKRKDAREIGKLDNPYDAAVSVLMLREGWDVPEVSVILLLRKFSSKVYGQQVIGRGLRRIVREDGEREILAVVDHPKLEHGWLWKLVSARVREEVSLDDKFGDEELPEIESPQELIKPELLIDVPEAAEGEADFEDLLGEVKEVPVTEDWEKLLESVNYPRSKVEITKVKLRGVRGIHLGEDKQVEYGEAPEEEEPAKGKSKVAEITADELREELKARVLELTTELLYDHGFSSIKKGLLYDVVMDHIGNKLLLGKTLGLASQKDLEFSLYKLEAVERTFRRPGLVPSIIRYPNAKTF